MKPKKITHPNSADTSKSKHSTNSFSELSCTYSKKEVVSSYEEERRRQASLSFNVAFGFTIASGLISLTSVLLFLFGNASAAKATTIGGLTTGAVNVCWFWLYKDSNNRFDETHDKSEEEDKPE